MTLEQAVDSIVAELKAAGFKGVSLYGPEPNLPSLPLIQKQDTHEETVRLLKFRTTIPCDRKIYSEGMLFIPIPS